MIRTGRALQPASPAAWPAYAAALWALLFALPSFYWAAGGVVGSGTIARNLDALGWASDPPAVAATGVLKVLAGLLPLALMLPRLRPPLRRLVLIGVWAAGSLFALYGGASLVQHALMVAGVVETPALLGESAVRWHLALWDPWWLLGGALFLTTAWQAGRPARR